MTNPDHPGDDVFLRAMDDELSGAEIVQVESHLLQCEPCKRNYQKLRFISAQVESLLAGMPVQNSAGERADLAKRLEARQNSKPTAQNPGRVLQRFGWGMGIAAMLALGITLFPGRHTLNSKQTLVSEVQPTRSLQIDGESFILLPYSNPELPVSTSHIVQMQVPISSLTDAGIVVDSVSNEIPARDTPVLADVLLGMDGQPFGVHVLGVQ